VCVQLFLLRWKLIVSDAAGPLFPSARHAKYEAARFCATFALINSNLPQAACERARLLHWAFEGENVRLSMTHAAVYRIRKTQQGMPLFNCNQSRISVV
jgi:hypothetical protein